MLRHAFDVEFTVLDAASGEVVIEGAGQPGYDWTARVELCREVARRERPEFIDEEDPLLVLAVPLGGSEGDEHVAVAAFVTRPVAPDENMDAAARTIGHVAGRGCRLDASPEALGPGDAPQGGRHGHRAFGGRPTDRRAASRGEKPFGARLVDL